MHSSDRNKAIGGCLGGLVIFIGLWFILGVRTVDVGHIGIVKTGGSLSSTADPGFLHIWLGTQSFEEIDLRTQKQQFQQIDASSKELQTVKVDGTITYHIAKEHAVELYQRVGVDDLEGKLIQPALQDYVKEVTPNYAATEVLAHRGEIRQHAISALNDKLTHNYPGLVVDDIFITNIGFSDAYAKAIEDKQVAAQQVLQAQQLQDKARIDAQTAVIQAQGESQSNQAKQVGLTPELVQYMAVQKWDGHMPQVTSGGTPFINLGAPKQ